MADELQSRLEAHLAHWLGAWPPEPGRLTVVGSLQRTVPSWDGSLRAVLGVSTPEGTILSVPPDVAPQLSAVKTLEEAGARLPAALGRSRGRLFQGVFRRCHELLSGPQAGEWVPTEDPRVPPWLKPFNGDVLIAWDGQGAYAAGVGRKIHDRWGQEISVGTEPEHRGQGLARRLVIQAARRIFDDGAVATYLHAPDNTASAHVASASGFPDQGWKIIGIG
jgi:GNAT superfamily N-acetyltransferase